MESNYSFATSKASRNETAPSIGAAAPSIGAAAPSNDEAASSASTPRFRSLPFVRGLFWPPFCDDWDSRLDALAAFEPRDNDVFVVSYPKCGHHWSFEFLSMIISGQTELPEGMYGGITQGISLIFVGVFAYGGETGESGVEDGGNGREI